MNPPKCTLAEDASLDLYRLDEESHDDGLGHTNLDENDVWYSEPWKCLRAMNEVTKILLKASDHVLEKIKTYMRDSGVQIRGVGFRDAPRSRGALDRPEHQPSSS